MSIFSGSGKPGNNPILELILSPTVLRGEVYTAHPPCPPAAAPGGGLQGLTCSPCGMLLVFTFSLFSPRSLFSQCRADIFTRVSFSRLLIRCLQGPRRTPSGLPSDPPSLLHAFLRLRTKPSQVAAAPRERHYSWLPREGNQECKLHWNRNTVLSEWLKSLPQSARGRGGGGVRLGYLPQQDATNVTRGPRSAA